MGFVSIFQSGQENLFKIGKAIHVKRRGKQLMRQTPLVARVIADSETPETEWLHVHVIPERNVTLRKRVKDAAPLLIGGTLEETWRSALKAPDRYRVVTPTDVVADETPPRWEVWRRFLAERYLT